MVAAVKGYRLILVMPESMSVERRRLMSIYGAEFVLTPERNERSHRKRKRCLKLPNAWLPLQFDNPANIEIHKTATAQKL
jgi:cysteine synthase A